MAGQDGQPGHRAQRAVPVRIAQSAAEQRVELSGQVVDGDQVTFGVGEGELPAERPVGGGGDDPDSGGGQLVVQRLRVVGPEPQRDPGAAGRPRPSPRRAAAPATANGIGAVANTTAPGGETGRRCGLGAGAASVRGVRVLSPSPARRLVSVWPGGWRVVRG